MSRKKKVSKGNPAKASGVEGSKISEEQPLTAWYQQQFDYVSTAAGRALKEYDEQYRR